MVGHVNNPLVRASTTYTVDVHIARGVPHLEFRAAPFYP